MPEMKPLADAMLTAASTVLGRLVEHPVNASVTTRHDHEGSIRIDDEVLVTLATIPSLGANVVVRFSSGDISRVVGLMLGSSDDTAEMGAMQLSIVSETVSQVAGAMAEQLARDVGASVDGVRAELCTDATNLPPPPFESYEGMISVGDAIAPTVAIDFDGVTLSKLAGSSSTEHAPAAAPAATAAPAASAPASPPLAARDAVAATKQAKQAKQADKVANAQSVAFTTMAPTPIRTAPAGQSNLDLVHDVPLQISAVLGKTALTLRDVVSLQAGSVFELDKLSTDPIDLYVNNILIARGEVVVVDDKFAVKISELNPSVG